MQKQYYKKTFRMEPSTYKRILVARNALKCGPWSSTWDKFLNKLMDQAGIGDADDLDKQA